MYTNLKWSIGLVMTCSLLLFSISVNATVASKGDTKSERTSKKVNRQQDRIHKKINKIQSRIIKAKTKAGAPVLDDSGFLEGSDDRVRWGLIGLAGGLLLVIILAGALKWIGWLGIIAGLGLLLWYLIEDVV